MAEFILRKITNLKKARKTASHPKSAVKVLYSIMITVFIALAGWGIAQLYQQELEEQQQEINVKALGMTYPATPTITRKERIETFQKAINQEFITDGMPKNNPSRKTFFTNPYYDMLSKQLVVTASSHVYQGNKHIGNIGIDFTLERLNGFVKKLGGRDTMIFTTEGKVLSHPSLQQSYRTFAVDIKHLIGNFTVRTQLLKLLKTTNKGQVAIDGYVITYQRLNNAPWMIVNITSIKNLVEDIMAKQLPIILGVIVGMTILLSISLKVINQVFIQLNEARMVAELANEKLKQALTELKLIASTDTLTGAWNRLYFEQIVFAEMNRQERHNQALSLLILDIDYFKSINDNYGHQIGDFVLVEIAHLLKENIRTFDILTRWGGEEFVILAPSTSISEAYDLADRLRLVIAQHSFPEVGNITVSFGAAQFETAENLYSCFKRADDALYHAKHSGRNIVVAAPSMTSVYQLQQLTS